MIRRAQTATGVRGKERRVRRELGLGLALAALTAGALTSCGRGSDPPEASGSPTLGSDTPSSSPTITPTTPTTPSGTPTGTGPTNRVTTRNIAGLPVGTIVDRVEKALADANTMRITGTYTSAGTTTTVDLSFGKTGTQGTVTSNGATVRLIRLKQTVFLQLTADAWRQVVPKSRAQSVIETMDGRWLQTTVNNPDYRDYTAPTDLDSLVDDVFAKSARQLSKVPVRSVGGVRCVGIDDGQAVLWIDVRTARPIELVPREFDGPGGLGISQYNTAKQPSAPPEEMVVDASKISG